MLTRKYGLNASLRITMACMLVLLLAAGCGQKSGKESTSLMIKGSDTMVHLVSSWAERFMAIDSGINISVTGGGSGTGIAALINGTTDICASSRDMKAAEKQQAIDKGITPLEIKVALDGRAVIIHPENPVAELTMEQIGKIYTGAYTNWKQVGGPDQKITVLSRESSSGTYVFFQEHVLNKQDYTPEARLMPATSAIIQAISTDKYSIGYVGLGYAEEAAQKVKVLGLKADDQSPAIFPSLETVLNNSYSIARALYLITNGEPQGAVRQFIDFCLSSEGQKIVAEVGYVPVK